MFRKMVFSHRLLNSSRGPKKWCNLNKINSNSLNETVEIVRQNYSLTGDRRFSIKCSLQPGPSVAFIVVTQMLILYLSAHESYTQMHNI